MATSVSCTQVVIGCRSLSELAGEPETEELVETGDDGAHYYPGLFESYESRGAYMARRRWFHEQRTGEIDILEDQRPVLDTPRTPKRSPLNEYGHSEDRDDYRKRREWYYQKSCDHGGMPDSAKQCGTHDSGNAPAGTEVPKGAWRTLVRAIVIMVLALSVWFSANSFLTDIATEYDITKRQATLLTVLVNIGFTVGATSSAVMQLPDRICSSRLLLIGCLGSALANAVLVTGCPFVLLLAARFSNGIAIAFVYPVLMRFTAGWFPKARRGFALGWVIGSLTVGIAFPSLLKASFPDTPWRGVVAGTSGLALVASALAYGMSDGPHAERAPAFSARNLVLILRSSNWRLVTSSYCAHNIELFGGWAWIGAFLQSYFDDRAGGDGGKDGKAIASAAAFIVIAVGAIGAVLGGYLADRIGKRQLILVVHVISGTAIALLPKVASVAPPVVVLTVSGIWGVNVIADSAQYSALLAEVLPEKRLLGTAITLSLALGFTSTAVGIYTVPILFDWAGWAGAFPCLAIGPFIGIIAIWAVQPPQPGS